MKSILAKFGVATLAALAPIALHAQQTRPVEYGKTTIALGAVLGQQLQSVGASITYLDGAPITDGMASFTATSGALDLNTAYGEIVHKGGLLVSGQGQTIVAKDFDLDVTSATNATISGIVVLNGQFLGRQPIFMINMTPNVSLPLAPQNYTLTVNGLSLGLSQLFVGEVNTLAGQNLLTTATQVGTLSTFLVVGPQGTY